MDIFIARQPIFDRSLDVYGYELLYREAGTTRYNHSDGSLASASVIVDGLLGMGIKAMTGGKRAFINFTHDLLLNEVATILPKSMIAVEILEDVLATPQIISVCEKLKQAGYLLVLDDFVLKRKFNPLIELADIIKVDFLNTSDKYKKFYVLWFETQRVKLLAEKVETRQTFEQARDMGYSFFQGYFFGQPEILSAKDFPAYKLNYFKMLQEVSRPEMDFGELEKLIKSDVSMSYKLLKFINSAFFGFPVSIESIRQALTLLGVQEIRRWLFLIALTLVAGDTPDELLRLSLIRANFCESIAEKLGLSAQKSESFMMGLFSMIDAVLGRPMLDVLAELPLSESVKQALLQRQGPLGGVYDLVIAYEKGNWEKVCECAARLSLNESGILPIYLKSLERANTIFSSVS